MTQYDLGQVVGASGQDGDDGSTIWNTSTAPTYANSKYTFTISNLTGKTGFTIAVNDLIFYSTYYYIVSAVNSTTVDCTTRVSIKGSDASVTVVDNLTSDSSTSVLSAKQGKVLNTNKVETSAIATSFSSTTSDSKVPSEKLVKTELDKKIGTSNTSGLVKNDGTIDTNSYITSSSLPTKTSDLTNDGSSSSDSLVYVETSATSGLLKNDGTVDTTSYSTFSGSYTDLSNKPSIPSSSSDLSDGSSLVKTSSTTGLLKNDGSVDTSSYITSSALSGYQTTSNLVTSFSSTTSDSKYPSEKLVKTELDKKIATSSTTGLVKNDGSIDTSSYITSSALSGYQTTANLVTSFSGTTSDSKYPSEKLTKTELDKKISKSNSATGLLKDDGTVMTSGTGSSNWAVGNHTHSAYVNPTKVTSWSSTPSDDNVASEKLIKDSLDAKQATLVSGTSIKTINNESLLGSGNISVGGGSSVDIVTAWESTPSDSKVASEKLVKDTIDTKADSSHTHYAEDVIDETSASYTNIGISDSNADQQTINEAINGAIGDKQDTLVSGTSIKTINNESLLGSGNISVGGGSSVDIVTSWESTLSDSKVASEKLTKDTIDLKSDSTHTHGRLNNDGTISTTSSATMAYFCGIGASANTLYKSDKLSSAVIVDTTAHSNLGTSANATQATINAAIDTLIGQAISYINQ